ncbi:MAG: Hsp33 family molecular chaperone HslO [Gammaproteobacteria bacterium]
MQESERDNLRRFVIEGAGVRGVLVRLNATWDAVRDCHPYPPAVRDLLGEALAAVTLLSATIKLEGSLILQAQGEGPLRTLVAQAGSNRTVRGLARWDGEVPGGELAEAFGAGRLVLTTHNAAGEPYQGIVPLEGAGLAQALETYFAQSEQLPTRLWLAAGAAGAAGLMLQVLPHAARDPDDWHRVALMAGTVSPRELQDLPALQLLHRLFSEDDVRVLEAEPVAFRCGCSRARIERTLAALGAGRVDELAEDDPEVVVTCEFCNRRYVFDRVDLERALASAPGVESSGTVH